MAIDMETGMHKRWRLGCKNVNYIRKHMEDGHVWPYDDRREAKRKGRGVKRRKEVNEAKWSEPRNVITECTEARTEHM